MLKKQPVNLQFKDQLALASSLESFTIKSGEDDTVTKSTGCSRNCWSGYRVRFRNPRNFQEYAIDEQFNRWSDMVTFFKSLDAPYHLSEGSLKDLLYGTYTRRGKHGLSLNDLVEIEKISRTRLTKLKRATTETVAETVAEQVAEQVTETVAQQITETELINEIDETLPLSVAINV